jgi:hypothetical protein
MMTTMMMMVCVCVWALVFLEWPCLIGDGKDVVLAAELGQEGELRRAGDMTAGVVRGVEDDHLGAIGTRGAQLGLGKLKARRGQLDALQRFLL